MHSLTAVSPDLFSLFHCVMYMGWCAYSFIINLIGWPKVETGKRLSVVNWYDVFTPTFFLFLLKEESGNRWEWSHYIKILAFLHFHFATGHYWCYRYETSLIWFVVSSKTLTRICLLSEKQSETNFRNLIKKCPLSMLPLTLKYYELMIKLWIIQVSRWVKRPSRIYLLQKVGRSNFNQMTQPLELTNQILKEFFPTLSTGITFA